MLKQNGAATTSPGRASQAYPPAPWQFVGQLWTGVVRVSASARLPAGLTPILRSWRVVTLVYYGEGTLRYNELMIGTLARYGRHIGVFVEHLWVDSHASLLGGREIWGLPKELATFTADEQGMHVSDAAGLIATIQCAPRTNSILPVFLIPAGIGRLGDRWSFVAIRMWMGLRPLDMRISAWSDRFAYRVHPKAILGFAGTPFRAIIPPPTLL